MTVPTALPGRLGTDSVASKRKELSFSFMPKKFNHKCIHIATIADMEWHRPAHWPGEISEDKYFSNSKYALKPSDMTMRIITFMVLGISFNLKK